MIPVTTLAVWITALVLVVPTLSIPYCNGCPKSCSCFQDEDSFYTAKCSSLDFTDRICSKDIKLIKSLDVSRAYISHINKNLKKLYRLEKLNLSENKLKEITHFSFNYGNKLKYFNLSSNAIKSFSAKQLPPNLEVLDVSTNNITELPMDLASLISLKKIHVGGNPFSCSYKSLEIRDLLLDKKVEIIGRPLCVGPAKFRGQQWRYVVDLDEYLKITDDFQGDEPGSGDVHLENEGSGSNIFENGPPKIYLEKESTTVENDFNFEGSGIEFSTREPIEEPEGSGSGAVPEGWTEVTLFFTTDFTSPEPVEEPLLNKTEVRVLAAPPQSPTQPTVEVSTESVESVAGNVEANQSENNPLGINIFLILMVISLVGLLIYYVKKRNERKRQVARQRNADLEKAGEAGIELMPQTHISKEKTNGNTDSSPLMNGQNTADEEKECDTKLSSDLGNIPFVETRNKDTPYNSNSLSGGSPYLNVSNPDVVSVKVKASEIPDSIPRTPILVDRRKTSDGTVVTQNLNQSASSGD